MKRVCPFLLSLALILVLGGCSVGVLSETPSKQQIKSDVQAALLDKNENVTFMNVEIHKSLSKEDTYFASVSITGESKYADWDYEAEVTYTKYDQGWAVDKIEWITEQFTVVRTPDIKGMTTHAEASLSALEGAIADDIHPMLPIIDPTMELLYVEKLDTTAMKLEWKDTDTGYFGEKVTTYSTWWGYNIATDDWTLLRDADAFYGYYEFNEGSSSITVNDCLWNVEGTWSDKVTYYNVPVSIEISNFSYNEFDAVLTTTPYNLRTHEFMAEEKVSGHFTRVYDKIGILADNKELHRYVFGDGAGHYISIQVDWSTVTIAYFPTDQYDTDIKIQITERLPEITQ